ncbi:hypothetical protein [Marinicella meishanensis]|uniref:hypothetical protein n=1 Tax=Marinicella meishanensis TaxID=2873263 RepID=UPI001CC05DDC|nr:hypothetical protein [Marinicella sp. NBU2979]
MNRSKQTIKIPAGEQAQIFSRSFSSVPMTYVFQAESVIGGEPQGQVETRIRRSIGQGATKTKDLQRHNEVKASFWDTFVEIHVVANEDVLVSLPKRRFKALRWPVMLALLVVLAASAVIMIQTWQ